MGRPGPAPAYDSPQEAADLAEVILGDDTADCPGEGGRSMGVLPWLCWLCFLATLTYGLTIMLASGPQGSAAVSLRLRDQVADASAAPADGVAARAQILVRRNVAHCFGGRDPDLTWQDGACMSTSSASKPGAFRGSVP
jgi:hypothetical protein